VDRRTLFNGRLLPFALVLPQLLISLVFFYWPAAEAMYYSLTTQDPFGERSVFVGVANFADVFHSAQYLDAIIRTLIFCGRVI
jgi:sn-glycerol 3-phosphate transport system permease protein